MQLRSLAPLLKSLPGLLSAEVRADRRFLRQWPTFPRRLGYKPNLWFPKTFNEKIQWLKLYDRNPLYPLISDKYAVRQFVLQRVGEGILNELYGYYRSSAEIDLNLLPVSFVLKTTHASAWNIICPDKSSLDWPREMARLDKWLATDYYLLGREWCYKQIQPGIVAERLLMDPQHDLPADYKFHCFNGRPRFIQVDLDRGSKHTRTFYDTSWKRMPFAVNKPANSVDVTPPAQLERMLEYAGRLAAGFRFMRVDFYEIAGRVIFGEMTCYPGAGSAPFSPPEYDLIVGELLRI